MNKLYYILLLTMLFMSCKTMQKSVSNHYSKQEQKTDSTFNEQIADASHVKRIEQKDTAVGIPAKSVTGSVSNEATQVKSAVTGRKMPVYHSKRDNGLEAWVAIDTNGNIEYGANSDSLTIVISGIARERDSFFGLWKSAQLRQVFKTSDSTNVQTSETVVQRKSVSQWVLNNVYWLLPLVLLIGWFIKKHVRW